MTTVRAQWIPGHYRPTMTPPSPPSEVKTRWVTATPPPAEAKPTTAEAAAAMREKIVEFVRLHPRCTLTAIQAHTGRSKPALLGHLETLRVAGRLKYTVEKRKLGGVLHLWEVV